MATALKADFAEREPQTTQTEVRACFAEIARGIECIKMTQERTAQLRAETRALFVEIRAKAA